MSGEENMTPAALGKRRWQAYMRILGRPNGLTFEETCLVCSTRSPAVHMELTVRAAWAERNGEIEPPIDLFGDVRAESHRVEHLDEEAFKMHMFPYAVAAMKNAESGLSPA